MQRMLPPTLVVLLLVAMIGGAVVWSWPTVHWSGRACGVLVLLAGLGLTMRHAQLFERLGTNIKTFDDPDQLVLTGAFVWTRNPMYLGFALLLLGAAMLLGSAVALAGPAIFVVVANQWYIPFEERRMSATFGADYDDYRSIVRRWVGPRSPA